MVNRKTIVAARFFQRALRPVWRPGSAAWRRALTRVAFKRLMATRVGFFAFACRCRKTAARFLSDRPWPLPSACGY